MITLAPCHIQQKACEAIEGGAFDFTAKYYAAYDLYAIARKQADAVHPRCIEALKGLLLSTVFNRQRQRRFLYREAANVLASLVQLGRGHPLSRQAYAALKQVLLHGRDHAHQAAAESLGSLPLAVCGPVIPEHEKTTSPVIGWKKFLQANGISEDLQFTARGRSLTAALPCGGIAVVKLARKAGDGPALLREIQWMDYIGKMSVPGCQKFDVPRTMRVKGKALFNLQGIPAGLWRSPTLDSPPTAVGFVAGNTYYRYPNAPGAGNFLHEEDILGVMGRCAFLLGWLAGRGIVHEAPIPLFHNRVQQDRRRDGGVYEWFRAGRLDRWLDSCAYPNFGCSGLRDFEHFISINQTGMVFYRHLGNHFLSLLLVAGSYFRARHPLRRGWTGTGEPVDCRDLFDRELLAQLIMEIYRNYYHGFVGKNPESLPSLYRNRLVDRMVDEMGVDRHMEEYLRVADQRQMSRRAFEAFLMARGYDARQVSHLGKGQRDICIRSGPHLGAFNRGISLPELIEAAAGMAAACVAERYLLESGS